MASGQAGLRGLVVGSPGINYKKRNGICMTKQDSISITLSDTTIEFRGTPDKAAAATETSSRKDTGTHKQTPAATADSAATEVDPGTPPRTKQDATPEEVQDMIEMPSKEKTPRMDTGYVASERHDSTQPKPKSANTKPKIHYDSRPASPVDKGKDVTRW